MLVCTIGDLLLDVIVRLDGPIAADTDAYGRTRVGAGGQAANVASWAAHLGGRSRVIAKRPPTRPGGSWRRSSRGAGSSSPAPKSRPAPATIVSIATPDGGRAMLSDRGVCPSFAPGELDAASLEGCDWLHVTGLQPRPSAAGGARAGAAALAPRVASSPPSTAAIEDAGAGRVPRACPSSRPRSRAGQRGGGRAARRLEARDRRGQARAQAAVSVGDGVDTPRSPPRWWTRPARATRSRPGSSLGGPEAALGAAARCVAQLGAMP